MRSILNLVLDYQSRTTIIPLSAFLAIVGTGLIFWISNKNKYIKYVPGLILVFIGIYNLVEGFPRMTDDEGLNMVLRFGIFFVAGFVSLCFALILGIIEKSKQPNNLKREPGRVKRFFMRDSNER